MPLTAIPRSIRDNFEVHEWRHASAILETDFPSEWADLCDVLPKFRLRRSSVVKGGGNKSEISIWFDRNLNEVKGWTEKKFDTSVVVDGVKIDSPTHSIDCFKNCVALEIEWNRCDEACWRRVL